MTDGLRWLLVPLLILGFFGAGFGAESSPVKKPASGTEVRATVTKQKKTNATGHHRYKGEITTLDVKAGTFSVKGTTDEKSFMAQDAAKDSIERMTVGERVRVTYSEKDGRLVATSVRRLKPKAAKSEKHLKSPHA